MTENEIEALKSLNSVIKKLINGQVSVSELKSIPEDVPAPVKELSDNLTLLVHNFQESQGFLSALSKGEIDVPPPKGNNLIAPFKQMHSDLAHLLWQTKQIAEGDYSQRVSFMGDFSIVFNNLIEALKERKILEANLAKSNATKDRFFSIIAHDLLSPVNVALGFSDLLLKRYDNYDDKERKEHISLICERLKATYKLLENILLWVRSQKGQLKFVPENFNLKLVVDENISLLQPLAKEKGIFMESLIQGEESVCSDKSIITTIVRNLLSNAVKFTRPNGTVKVSAREIVPNDDKNYVEVAVTDTGVGITVENIKKIFKVEDSFSTSGTNNETGTGLGLMLCKELVEICGGNIWAESEIGKGSTFKFTLPQLNDNQII